MFWSVRSRAWILASDNCHQSMLGWHTFYARGVHRPGGGALHSSLGGMIAGLFWFGPEAYAMPHRSPWQTPDLVESPQGRKQWRHQSCSPASKPCLDRTKICGRAIRGNRRVLEDHRGRLIRIRQFGRVEGQTESKHGFKHFRTIKRKCLDRTKKLEHHFGRS